MPVPVPSLPVLALTALTAPAVVPTIAHEADLSTETYLEQPELFQIATLAGALAVLRHTPALASEPDDQACFARWEVHEDVLAIFADYIRRNPIAEHDPFAASLISALRERCDGD